jgi:tetratricopeptide (TPR) repeat protein
MKTITKIFIILVLIGTSTTVFSQRKITGVVYNNGEPAAGILVEAHRSKDTYFTGFDGAYEIEVNEKTKFIRFTYLDESKKVDMDDITSDVYPFSFDGSELPNGDIEPGVVLKTLEQLNKEKDMEFLNNYSLYREFFRQDDYNSALPHWRKVYKTYPKSTVQIYIDGQKMLESKIQSALDEYTKKQYLDTIVNLFDKRIKYLDKKEEIMGRKAVSFLEIALSLDLPESEYKEVINRGFKFCETAIEKSGNKVEPAVLVLYMQSTRRLFSLSEFSQTTVLETFEKAMEILNNQLSDDEMKDKAEQAIPLVEQIIESSGALDCKSMVDLYAPKFKESPNDIEQIKKMLQMFRRYDCENELVLEMSEKLYKLEPSAEAAYNMARMFVIRENYTKAFEYYKEAYNSDAEPFKKATYYYEAAGLSLQQGDFKQSRDLLKKAVSLRADYCEAYMMLGEVYTQASKDFSDDDFVKNTVFWLAVDYFNKAAKYENCSSDASSRAKTYKNYFPAKEEVFFRGLSEGENHRIGGWINETTTVRVKAQ